MRGVKRKTNANQTMNPIPMSVHPTSDTEVHVSVQTTKALRHARSTRRFLNGFVLFVTGAKRPSWSRRLVRLQNGHRKIGEDIGNADVRWSVTLDHRHAPPGQYLPVR